MPTLFDNPTIQYGALGLAFVLTSAFIRAFFILLRHVQAARNDLQTHHNERERAFTGQFLACVDRNSAALEKVENGLQRILLQMAQNDSHGSDSYVLEVE